MGSGRLLLTTDHPWHRTRKPNLQAESAVDSTRNLYPEVDGVPLRWRLWSSGAFAQVLKLRVGDLFDF